MSTLECTEPDVICDLCDTNEFGTLEYWKKLESLIHDNDMDMDELINMIHDMEEKGHLDSAVHGYVHTLYKILNIISENQPQIIDLFQNNPGSLTALIESFICQASSDADFNIESLMDGLKSHLQTVLLNTDPEEVGNLLV